MAVTIAVSLSLSFTININNVNTINVVYDQLNQTQEVLNKTIDDVKELEQIVEERT